jgi:hypothetical protein
MKRKSPEWESELWSHLSNSDGIKCPVYSSCRLEQKKAGCFSEDDRHLKLLAEFIDKDELVNDDQTYPIPRFPKCPGTGRIFQLVGRLALKYLQEARINRPPVPTGLISHVDSDTPIEVRQVPLKAYHGSVWQLHDKWVVQLNTNDSFARQRFTLFHEIFHIMAHSKATPVFKKAGYQREGTFNEMLADHFAAVCLLPEKLVRKTWPGIKDLEKMAAVFEAPKPLTWLALKLFRLT